MDCAEPLLLAGAATAVRPLEVEEEFVVVEDVVVAEAVTVLVCAAACWMPNPPAVTATAASAAADQRRTVPGDVERVGFIVGAFPVVGVSTMAFRARGHLCRLRAVRMGLLSVSCAPVCRPLHRSAGTPRSQDSGVGHGHGQINAAVCRSPHATSRRPPRRPQRSHQKAGCLC